MDKASANASAVERGFLFFYFFHFFFFFTFILSPFSTSRTVSLDEFRRTKLLFLLPHEHSCGTYDGSIRFVQRKVDSCDEIRLAENGLKL